MTTQAMRSRNRNNRPGRMGMPIVFLCVLFPAACLAAERCTPLPGDEYEKIYCELKKRGMAQSLPDIYEFRKNPPMTQAILLRKPAERIGIKVNLPERKNEETVSRQQEILIGTETPAPVVKTPSAKTPPRSAPPVAVAAPVAPEQAQAVSLPEMKTDKTDKLQACSLEQFNLKCPDGEYRYVGNKANQQLAEDALSDTHKLALPVYRGAADDKAAVEKYLVQAYGRYLAGMMEIGLGASTMTYTKFANLYNYYVEQHLDFAGRFETMYEFLKKDKASIAVSTRPEIAGGFNLQYCTWLDNLIACDYQKTNYVFSRASM